MDKIDTEVLLVACRRGIIQIPFLTFRSFVVIGHFKSNYMNRMEMTVTTYISVKKIGLHGGT